MTMRKSLRPKWPPRRERLRKFRIFVRLFLFLCFALPGYGNIAADGFSEHRAQVGLKLFKTLVNADLDISEKVDQEQLLHIALVAHAASPLVQEYQQQLTSSFASLENQSVQVEILQPENLSELEYPVGAIFIAETFSQERLESLIQYAEAHSLIIFSPFEGDVESGVLAGLSVQATVRPLINSATLKRSKINIKPFYLKVAKRYE